MKKQNLLFYSETSGEMFSEKKIRQLAFEENIGDLNHNKDDFLEGLIPIESVCKYLINSLKADIKEVIKDLNENWGYEIDIYKKIENKGGKK